MIRGWNLENGWFDEEVWVGVGGVLGIRVG